MASDERVERDTAEEEDVPDLLPLLLPAAPLPALAALGLHFSRRLFAGWVKQPSPCCGAASLAGAVNALLRLPRSDARALDHRFVLSLYRRMFRELLQKKISSFERRLQGSFREVLALVEEELAAEGRTLGARKARNVSAKLLGVVVQRILRRPSLPSAWRLIAEMETPEPIIEEEEDEGARNGVIVVSAEVSVRTSFRMDDEAEDRDEEAEEAEGEGNPDKGSSWNWKRDFRTILKNLNGYRKLSDETCPSTACIGSMTLVNCVKAMVEAANTHPFIEATFLMGIRIGRKSALPIPVSHSDDEKTVATQWDKLRSAFAETDSVLLFHLRNHYALIFALREYSIDDEGELVREVLTARKGQRPNVWIDFEGVRAIVLEWAGYNILKLSLRNASPLPDFQDFKFEIMAGVEEDIEEETELKDGFW